MEGEESVRMMRTARLKVGMAELQRRVAPSSDIDVARADPIAMLEIRFQHHAVIRFTGADMIQRVVDFRHRERFYRWCNVSTRRQFH